MKLNRRINIRVNAVVHWTLAGRLLQPLARTLIKGFRHRHLRVERINPTRIGRHFFFDRNLNALQVKPMLVRLNPHDGRYTGAQRRCHEIRGGKRRAAAMIIRRGIRGQGDPTREMLSRTVKVPNVLGINLNHELLLLCGENDARPGNGRASL